MSWLVQTLLRSKIGLKTQSDLESDDYLNLLIIEQKIKEMKESGQLSNDEIMILEQMSDGKPLYEASNALNKYRNQVTKNFYLICDRIAFALGGEFTDDGYLNYMQKKYKLTDVQVEQLKVYMHGRFRYTVMKKRRNSGTN